MKINPAKPIFLTLVLSYLLYPVWSIPAPPVLQYIVLSALLLFSALLALAYAGMEDIELGAPVRPDAVTVAPLLLAVVMAIPLWVLPVPTGTDEQSHVSPAATLLAKMLPDWRWRLGALVAVALGIVLFLALRKMLAPKRVPALPAALAVFAVFNLYFLFFLKSGLLLKIGKWDTIMRYPPLPKFMYLAGYMAAGIQEWVPRSIQFLFIAGTALVILRLVRSFSGREDRFSAIAAVVLFPTFFNLSLWGELEGGTVFFFALASYLFIKSLKGRDLAAMTQVSVVLVLGVMYRQLVLGLILAMLTLLAGYWVLEKKDRGFYYKGVLRLLPALAAGLPFLVMSSAYGIRNSGLVWSNFLSPDIMLLNIKLMPATLGWPVFLLSVAALAYSVFRYRSREMWVMIALSAAYYLMISGTSAAGFVRHVQPAYLFPVFALALAASDLCLALSGEGARRLFRGALTALMAYACILAPAPYQRKTWFNRHDNVTPYTEVLGYLSALPGQISVYAPMYGEPINFYLAKYGLFKKVRWERDPSSGFAPEALAAGFEKGDHDFMLLPYSRLDDSPEDFRAIADALIRSGRFVSERFFEYHGNKAVLLKKIKK